MLATVEFIIDNRQPNTKITELLSSLAEKNFDDIEFTIHVENQIIRLRLINSSEVIEFDSQMALEQYRERVISILHRRTIPFSVIDTLNLSKPLEVGKITN